MTKSLIFFVISFASAILPHVALAQHPESGNPSAPFHSFFGFQHQTSGKEASAFRAGPFGITGKPADGLQRTYRGEEHSDTSYLLMEYVSENFDTLAKTWHNMRKQTCTYDSRRYLSGLLFQFWEDSVWKNDFRWTLLYRPDGRRAQTLIDKWSDSGWTNFRRQLDTLFADGREFQSLMQNWKSGAWVDSSRITFTLDSLSYVVERRFEQWNSGLWTPTRLEQATYDSARNGAVEQLNLTWSGTEWINDSRWVFFPGNTWYPTEELYQTWGGGVWINNFRYLNTYDVAGGLSSSLTQVWAVDHWDDNSRTTYTTDSHGNLLHALEEVWNNTSWDTVYRETYTWQEVITGVPTRPENPRALLLADCYPNPFNPATIIQFELPSVADVTLKVYDVLGREIAVLVDRRLSAGLHESRFDGSNAASGVYFFRLRAGKFSLTKKMLLIR